MIHAKVCRHMLVNFSHASLLWSVFCMSNCSHHIVKHNWVCVDLLKPGKRSGGTKQCFIAVFFKELWLWYPFHFLYLFFWHWQDLWWDAFGLQSHSKYCRAILGFPFISVCCLVDTPLESFQTIRQYFSSENHQGEWNIFQTECMGGED